MDRTGTIETVTKCDINDLKAYANAIGVKCENCANWRYKETLGTDIGICFKGGYTLVGQQTIRIETKYSFCNSFNKKENNH